MNALDNAESGELYSPLERMQPMFGTSGIRGPIGEAVTPELGVKLGDAVARWGAGRVVVGRDPRPSGRYLLEALRSGLRQHGVDVIDVGMAATPTVARAVTWYEADCGVAVTASHNPPEDNGFKLWLPTGQAFRPNEQEELEVLMETDRPAGTVAWDEVGGHERRRDAAERHVTALLDAVSLDRSLRVVVDVGNGAGGVTATALDRLGCEVVTINAQPDGGFPGRPSEPTEENCEDLTATVPALGADLGIAHDGDADRMRAVAADGRFLGGDVLLAVFAGWAADSGDRVAAPVDTSLAVEDALASREIDLVRTPVGDVFVAEAIRTHDAAFGGEPSGAWIWPEETLSPDGPLAACKLVEGVAEAGALVELVEAIDQYPIRRGSIEVSEKDRVMGGVRSVLEDDPRPVGTTDGVRVEDGDGWFLIRPSGTEPLVRITAEARDDGRADGLLAEARSIVEEAIERDQPI